MTTSTRFRPLRSVAALLALLGAAVLGLGPVAGPAGAHEGDAVLAVEVHPAGQSIHYIVRVTWANDGHAAVGATVTATALAPDGTQLTPVALAPADDDGRYAGVLEYPAPGMWTLRITSIEPDGTLEQPQEVTATAPTQAPDVTTGEATDGGFAPADDGTGTSADESGDGTDGAAHAPASEEAGTDGDDGGFPVLLVVAAAAVVLVGAVIAANIIRRTRATPPAGGPAAGGPPAEGPPAEGPAAGEASAGAAPESAATGAPPDPTGAG
jgi:hypothetical protein